MHVVFGLVISGFEVIEQIENLKTDAASRPYADVRVIDCGVLATKSTKDVFEKKRKKPTHSEDSDSSRSSSSSESPSESEGERERSRRKKHKRRPRVKHSRKRRKEASSSEEPRTKPAVSPKLGHSERSGTNEKRSCDANAKREKPVVRPEEIPPVPENRFLLRRDAPAAAAEPEPKIPDVVLVVSDQKPSVSKSGRKIRGRGTIRYHTPPRSRSCSESEEENSSETPPHWKEEMQRLRAYRPPSGEKWSKGDKLSDPCSSRWDERSLSQRSRSWSCAGDHSDLSTARRSDGHRKRRKGKKVKHKKKGKRQKHCRRRRQTRRRRVVTPSAVQPSESPARQARPSRDRARSPSSSSHHSSPRDWSKSEDQSSSAPSSRGSCRSESRARSDSGGSSRSRAASRSSSAGHSRPRSTSSSKSGRRGTAAKAARAASQLCDDTPAKTEALRPAAPQSGGAVVPPVVAESIPVIPLSDSPPPSRWKPGQKPWKPSYERIQEMKARAMHLLPVPRSHGSGRAKDTGSAASYRKRGKASESDRSAYSKYSNRSSRSSRRSRSRSSRSRSYSRSYTRSRSRSLAESRSRSRSGSQYSVGSRRSRSPSSTPGSSDGGRRATRVFRIAGKKSKTSSRRRSSSSEKTLHRKHGRSREKPSCLRRRRNSRSSAGDSSDSERSSAQGAHPAPEKEKRGKVGSAGHRQVKGRAEGRPEPGQERPRRRKRASTDSDLCRSSRKPKRKNCAGSKWDSESNSERDVPKASRSDSHRPSEKEEGEATSGSESEASEGHSRAKPLSARSTASTPLPGGPAAWRARRPPSSASASEGSWSSRAEPPRRGARASPQGEPTRKARGKSKVKRDKKHKAPKRKQTFHWQPPLEFGEEEEEELNERQVTQSKETKRVSESRESTRESIPKAELHHARSPPSRHGQATASEDARLPGDAGSPAAGPPALAAEDDVTSSPTGPQHAEEIAPGGGEDVLREDDNMEICTPERSSPARGGAASPVAEPRADAPDGSPVPKQDDGLVQPEAEGGKPASSAPKSRTQDEVRKQDCSSASVAVTVESTGKKESEKSQLNLADNKWKPLQGVGNVATPAAVVSGAPETKTVTPVPDVKPQGLRIEIKSKNKVRPGSLFDEVRKTARLNRRPRNQESSSDEQTSRDGDSQSRSPHRSRSKSEATSRHRVRSVSYSHSSPSQSSTSSYRSRSYSRSRSRGWYSRGRTRSRSSSYRTYKSHRTSSRSRSRSSSYDPHSRSRSYTYDSYYSRSRSRSHSHRSHSYRRGRSYTRRSRSGRSYGSDSESDRSYSRHRSPSESSRYS